MKEELAKARLSLKRAHQRLVELDQQIHEHHRHDNEICRRYNDYLSVSPASYLDRAGELLGKQFYRVAFVGPFSCGKSTLINAVLQEPGLLPSAAGECTLSITNLAKPAAGKGEQVEVHYFQREDAVRNVLTNIRYKPLFGKSGEQLLQSFDLDKAINLLRDESRATDKGRCEADLSLPELMKRRAEMIEFLDQLEEKAAQRKLGSVVYDSVNNAQKYLTTDHDGKGMGHLLLIQMVNIYKENQLFVHEGVQIIDLPGTDSINERQKELTHSYLHEADVVVNVLEPRGFSAADKDIESTVRGTTISSVKNKMFFVVNRFDTLHAKSMDEKGKFKRLVDGQIRTEIARSGFNPDWLYLTSALWSELESQSTLTDADKSTLDSLRSNGQERLKQLRGLDELNELPATLKQRVINAYETSGVSEFRSDILKYLKQDIERERLREIRTYLTRVLGHLESMLAPERDEVRDLLESTRHKVRQVGEFLDRVEYDTRGAVRKVEETLEANDQRRFQKRLMKINRQFEAFVEEAMAKDRPGLDFRDIADQVGVSNTQSIMSAIVDNCKKYLSEHFVSMLNSELSSSFCELVEAEMQNCQNEDYLRFFSKALYDNTVYLNRYETLLNNLKRDIAQLTEKRATEETWVVDELDLAPAAKKREWNDDVAARFRKTYATVFKDVYRDRHKSLNKVLLRYYKLALTDFMNGFNELIANVREEARHENLTIPVELLEHKSDKQALRRNKLVDYITGVESVQTEMTNQGVLA